MRLGARVFQIEFVDQVRDPKTGEVDSTMSGVFEAGQGLIQITRDRDPGQMTEDLCHEILHAFFSMAGDPLPAPEEEALVLDLAPWLHAFLAQNPVLVAQIIRGAVEPQDE